MVQVAQKFEHFLETYRRPDVGGEGRIFTTLQAAS